jgi:hypothetical protein
MKHGTALRVEAYQEYALGRKSFSMLGKDSLEQARGHFERDYNSRHELAPYIRAVKLKQTIHPVTRRQTPAVFSNDFGIEAVQRPSSEKRLCNYFLLVARDMYAFLLGT